MNLQGMETTKVDVLDHGFVAYVDHMGGDLRITNCARVQEEEWRGKQDEKLIHYLWKNRHTSPFEHVVFTFDVKAPIFVFRQWHRHRMASYNEISARYQPLPDEFYVPELRDIGLQHPKSHQSRIEDAENPHAEEIQDEMRAVQQYAHDVYQKLLGLGCPRELARTVIPVGTYSRMYTTVNLHSLLHFLTLRMDAHAQMEIRVYAEAMFQIIETKIPHALAAWAEGKEVTG